jgi:hypothetical protein
LVALSQTLTVSLERALKEAKFDTSTEHLSSSTGVATSFADRVAKLVAKHVPRLCLIMYSSQRDPMFYNFIRALSAFHASRYAWSANDAEVLGRQKCSSPSSSFPDFYGRSISPAFLFARHIWITATLVWPWYRPRMPIGSPSSSRCTKWQVSIVDGTMFNSNTSKETGIVFGIERNQNKFLYRSSDAQFHLGSEQESAFGIEQLPQAAAYVIAKDVGVSASVSRRA